MAAHKIYDVPPVILNAKVPSELGSAFHRDAKARGTNVNRLLRQLIEQHLNENPRDVVETSGGSTQPGAAGEYDKV